MLPGPLSLTGAAEELAESEVAAGDERAQEHLTMATTMYREMDMRFWLVQVEAELKELE